MWIFLFFALLYVLWKGFVHVFFRRLTASEYRHLGILLFRWWLSRVFFFFCMLEALQTRIPLQFWMCWVALASTLRALAYLCMERSERTFTRNATVRLRGTIAGVISLFAVLLAAALYVPYALPELSTLTKLLLLYDLAGSLVELLALCIKLRVLSTNAAPSQDELDSVDLLAGMARLLSTMLHYVNLLYALYDLHALFSAPTLFLLLQMRLLLSYMRAHYAEWRDRRGRARRVDAQYPDYAFDAEASEPDCPICLAALREGGGKRLPCGHGMHLPCLEQLLRRTPAAKCPICRAPMVGGDKEPAVREQSDAQQRHNQGMEARVEQIAAMFPQIARGDIRIDLRVTRSLDVTIENIINGAIRPADERE